MQFRNLEGISLLEITNVFNHAFSDYVVPITLTETLLEENIIRDNLDLNFSVGAFQDGQLIGFILQSIGFWNGKKTAYNGGTGVIPAARGRKLTQQLYAYSIPHLKAQGVTQCHLEVIKTNAVAIKTYNSIGFQKVRELDSFRGTVVSPENKMLPETFQIKELVMLDWELARSFWEANPSWSYGIDSAQRLGNRCKILGLFSGDDLIGYAVLLKSTNRLMQLAMAHPFRGKGYGHQLLHAITFSNEIPLTVINIDRQNTHLLKLMATAGLNKILSQYEMTLEI